MNNKIQEDERKELNKCLLKKTFVSELKSRKKVDFKVFLLDFVMLFIAFVLADYIIWKMAIHSWVIDFIITVVLVMVMQFIGNKCVEKLKGKN